MSDIWQYQRIINSIARRAKYFEQKYGAGRFNPYKESGFVHKETLKPLTESEFYAKYKGEYAEYKEEMLLKMGDRQYLKDRGNSLYEGLSKIADTTDNAELKAYLGKTNKSAVIKAIFQGKFNGIYTSYSNEETARKVRQAFGL